MSHSILFLTVDQAYDLATDQALTIKERAYVQDDLFDFLKFENSALVQGLKVPADYDQMVIADRVYLISEYMFNPAA